MTTKTMSPAVEQQFRRNAANARRPLVDNLLTESDGYTQMAVLEEDSKNAGALIVEGEVGRCNQPTKNKRYYSESIMRREIDRLQPRIKQRSLLAAVDHPTDGKSRIRESGAICIGLRVENDGQIIGRYEIVEDSTGGRDLSAFLRRGAAVGMSSRGLGSTRVNAEGYHVVGEDFKLHGFDFVADPACETAYPGLVSEDINTEDINEDQLRATFGDLIEQIEDRAREDGAEIAEEDVREQVEEEFKQALDEASEQLRDNIKLQVEAEIRESLREDFATKLVTALQEQRDEVRDVVKSELLSDPEVAGAKKFVEELATRLVPYQPDPNKQVVMDDEFESKLADLREQAERAAAESEEKDAELQAIAEQKQQAEEQARGLGFRLYVERAISGHPDAASLREMIGDPTRFESAEDLREHVASCLEQFQSTQVRAMEQANERTKVKEHKASLERKRAQLASEELNRLRSEMDEKINSLSERMSRQIREKDEVISEAADHIERLEEELANSRRRAEEADLYSYASRRVTGHPRAGDIMNLVESGRVTTKDEVRRLAEEWDYQATEPGGVSERIRRSLGRGREHPSEDDQKNFQSLMEGQQPIPGFEETGATLGELRHLAGISNDNGSIGRF